MGSSKPATRDCCEAAGLPKVTHYTLTKRSDIEEALKALHLHFPDNYCITYGALKLNTCTAVKLHLPCSIIIPIIIIITSCVFVCVCGWVGGWMVCVWWVKVVNFPAIMKPISGVSSLGVLKVEKAEDLERCAFYPHTVFFV